MKQDKIASKGLNCLTSSYDIYIINSLKEKYIIYIMKYKGD